MEKTITQEEVKTQILSGIEAFFAGKGHKVKLENLSFQYELTFDEETVRFEIDFQKQHGYVRDLSKPFVKLGGYGGKIVKKRVGDKLDCAYFYVVVKEYLEEKRIEHNIRANKQLRSKEISEKRDEICKKHGVSTYNVYEKNGGLTLSFPLSPENLDKVLGFLKAENISI